MSAQFAPFGASSARLKPRERKPRRERLVIEQEKAYRASNQYALDKLLNLERRYNQRLGMAQAGLAKTRKQIRTLLVALSADKMPDKSGG